MNSESVDLIYLDPPFNSNRTYSAGRSKPARSGKRVWLLTGSGPWCLRGWGVYSVRSLARQPDGSPTTFSMRCTPGGPGDQGF